DLVLYFLILCVSATVNWVVFNGSSALFNTYTFAIATSRFDTFGICIGICIIENAIKTYLLYTNISKKTLSKPICIVLSVIMVLPIIAFLVLLAMLNK
ncbi:MAG: hypothetical protein K2I73_05280, partial [Eubacterium sp.]|nr:hypothetical protein [Eubacterium sp.]